MTIPCSILGANGNLPCGKFLAIRAIERLTQQRLMPYVGVDERTNCRQHRSRVPRRDAVVPRKGSRCRRWRYLRRTGRHGRRRWVRGDVQGQGLCRAHWLDVVAACSRRQGDGTSAESWRRRLVRKVQGYCFIVSSSTSFSLFAKNAYNTTCKKNTSTQKKLCKVEEITEVDKFNCALKWLEQIGTGRPTSSKTMLWWIKNTIDSKMVTYFACNYTFKYFASNSVTGGLW